MTLQQPCSKRHKPNSVPGDNTPDDTTIGKPITEDDVPNDTLATILLLSSQFPDVPLYSGPAIVLKSQLYDILHNRTTTDRQLDDMRRHNVIRLLKINCGPDEYAVVQTSTYNEVITTALDAHPHLASAITQHILPHHVESSIARDVLLGKVAKFLMHSTSHIPPAANTPAANTPAAPTPMSHDTVLNTLLSAGLVCRDTNQSAIVHWTLSGVGVVVNAINAGKKELMGMLRRSRTKSLLLSALERKPKTLFPLGLRFHLRHLRGVGAITMRQTPSGPAIVHAAGRC